MFDATWNDTTLNPLQQAFQYLKNNGVTQREIADQLGVGWDESKISNIKSGKIKETPLELISLLENNYQINPEYLAGKSNIPLNYVGADFKFFQKIVSRWETVEHNKQNYLHVTMNQNLYDYLVELDYIHRCAESGSINEDLERKNLQQIYAASPKDCEYVVIPCDNFDEIVSTAIETRKKLEEVVDMWNLGATE